MADHALIYSRQAGHSVQKFGAVIMKTRNPADRPRDGRGGFDLNRARIRALEQLIADRHGGPCHDLDHAGGYAAVAASAFTMARVVRGWKRNDRSALDWIAKWCPLPAADVQMTLDKAARRTRGLTARRAGAMVGTSLKEIERLGLKTFAPVDRSTSDYEADRKARKNRMDRERIAAQRRAQGVRPVDTISAGSVARFCRENGLNRSSYRQAEKRGAQALRAFLEKKGIAPENWPHLSVGKRIPTEYNTATGVATQPPARETSRLAAVAIHLAGWTVERQFPGLSDQLHQFSQPMLARGQEPQRRYRAR